MMIAREEQQQQELLKRMQRGGRRSMMMLRLAFGRIKGDNRRHRESTKGNSRYRLSRDLGRLSKLLSRIRDGDYANF